MTKRVTVVAGLACLAMALIWAPGLGAQDNGPRTVEQAYPGFASGILKKAILVDMEPGVLLTSQGVEIKESRIREIVEAADPAVKEELEKNRFFLLEQEAVRAFLGREAASSGAAREGLSDKEAIQAYLDERFQDIRVSDEEAEAFYEANKEMVQGLPFEQVKAPIKEVLVQQKREKAFASLIQGLGRDKDIRINREWVEHHHALAVDNPVDKARMSGKPTMVEFGAEGCVPCDMMQPILEKLRKKYPDKLNVVFVHVGENRVLGARYGIQSIPVQVFYDENGREAFRHVGFYPESEVLKQLRKLGVE